MSGAREPKTLLESVRYFSDADVALAFFAGIRWPNGVACPRCESAEVGFMKTGRIWKCRTCAKQFSAKVGTCWKTSLWKSWYQLIATSPTYIHVATPLQAVKHADWPPLTRS